MSPQLFITSQTPLFHTSEYKTNGFLSIEDMNEHIIKQWNMQVRDEDIVVHAGDVFGHPTSFSQDRLKEVVARLSGQVYLIKGERDEKLSDSIWAKGNWEILVDPLVLTNNRAVSHIVDAPFLARFKQTYVGHPGWYLKGLRQVTSATWVDNDNKLICMGDAELCLTESFAFKSLTSKV